MNSDLSHQPSLVLLISENCLRILLVVGITMLSGCAAFQGYPERPVDLKTDLSQLTDNISAAKMTECFNKEGDEARACRNKFISGRMYATDIRFSEFEERLFRQTRESGFTATLATLGLTSAAAVTSGGGAQVLSGIAAFIIGGREAFKKEVLAERTIIAIHTAMRAKRAQVRLHLLKGLRQPIDKYPLALALTNVNEYYDAGTILGALIGITETVGAQAIEADEKLLELTPFSASGFTDEAKTKRAAIQKRLDSLPDKEVIALVVGPPTPLNEGMTQLLKEIDPYGQHKKNAEISRDILDAWIGEEVKVEDYPKWAKAIGLSP